MMALQNTMFVVAWPLALLIAWLAGEVLFNRMNVPRVSTYSVVGVLLGWMGIAGINEQKIVMALFANVALGLVLFELGYRVNVRWFRKNPWILVCGVLESITTFAVVWWITGHFELSTEIRWVISALSIATSPAALIRVTNELHSSGQVTERVLHICTINCLISIFLLQLIVGYWHLATSGSGTQAALSSIYVLFSSAVLGSVFGIVMPWLLRKSSSTGEGSTVVFAIALLLLTVISQALKISPLLAALAFGMVARERRVLLSNNQCNFGPLGDLGTIFLFVYVGTFITWQSIGQYMVLGLLLVGARLLTKIGFNVAIAHHSGTGFRKGALTGLALAPLSAFAILILEQSRSHGFYIAYESLAVMAGMLLVLEITGPMLTHYALRTAGETYLVEEKKHAA